MTKILPRGSTLPRMVTAAFTTVHDDQQTATFRIFEGERPLTIDNVALGKLTIGKLPPSPRGFLRIVLQITIDEHSNLDILVQQPKTALAKRLIINGTRLPSEEDIDWIIGEAQDIQEADQENIAGIMAVYNEHEVPADAVVKVKEYDYARDHGEV